MALICDVLTREPARLGPTRLITVDGPSGAGKSTVAAAVRDSLDADGLRAALVPTDHFATWDDPVGWWSRLDGGVLRPLQQGRRGRYRRWEWLRGEPRPGPIVEVPVPDVLIVEGVSAGRRAVTERTSVAVWVAGPGPLGRAARAVGRDGLRTLAHLRRWRRAERRWFAADETAPRCDVHLR